MLRAEVSPTTMPSVAGLAKRRVVLYDITRATLRHLSDANVVGCTKGQENNLRRLRGTFLFLLPLGRCCPSPYLPRVSMSDQTLPSSTRADLYHGSTRSSVFDTASLARQTASAFTRVRHALSLEAQSVLLHKESTSAPSPPCSASSRLASPKHRPPSVDFGSTRDARGSPR